jgi:hypothetical protein
MKKYDEIRSLKLFNKYCNNDFVCIISEWGNKVHQELGIKYNKGKCLEDIYAIDGRHSHSMSLQFEDENGKVMIARKEASLVLNRTEMFEDILRYIEKHYGISIDDKSYLHLLKLIKENWYCIITNDEYCIEIFETRDVTGLSHICTNELDSEIFKEKPQRILAVMDNITGKCFTLCSMCMSRYLDMSDKELKRFGV